MCLALLKVDGSTELHKLTDKLMDEEKGGAEIMKMVEAGGL